MTVCGGPTARSYPQANGRGPLRAVTRRSSVRWGQVAHIEGPLNDVRATVPLLQRLRNLHRDICLVWADGGYSGQLVDWCRQKLAFALEVVKRTDDMEGFVVLPRRWVVERTLSWLMHSRRLCRDYETLTATSEAMILFSMITRMSRRLARPRADGRH
ncbi:transposase [Streptomyces avermitilis]|uniref:transposase n=1 Tax=Streptomyces avermitilis TaxID=33903 RepID=UPI0033B245C3